MWIGLLLVAHSILTNKLQLILQISLYRYFLQDAFPIVWIWEGGIPFLWDPTVTLYYGSVLTWLFASPDWALRSRLCVLCSLHLQGQLKSLAHIRCIMNKWVSGANGENEEIWTNLIQHLSIRKGLSSAFSFPFTFRSIQIPSGLSLIFFQVLHLQTLQTFTQSTLVRAVADPRPLTFLWHLVATLPIALVMLSRSESFLSWAL